MAYQKKNKNTFTLIGQYNAALLKKGKKFKSEKGLLFIGRALKKKRKKPFYSLLAISTNKVKPYVGLLSKKIGSTTYRIPVSLTPKKETLKGITWVTGEPCGRKQGNFHVNVLNELSNLLANNGNAKSLKKKVVLHKLAEDNRMFIKYLF
jgi:small subunit ribosomal protein S7